jgi:hypothetical protein
MPSSTFMTVLTFTKIKRSDWATIFSSQIRSDIDGLKITAGIHLQTHRDLHRLISRRFPYAIFYRFNSDEALVLAVVDCRREPEWIEQHLSRIQSKKKQNKSEQATPMKPSD